MTPSPPASKSILLAGATGLVGSRVLARLLSDLRVSRVVAPSRRPLPPHPKLLDARVDYDALPADAEWWAVDAVICTLGTTIKVAGSQEAFRRVDRDYPLRFILMCNGVEFPDTPEEDK